MMVVAVTVVVVFLFRTKSHSNTRHFLGIFRHFIHFHEIIRLYQADENSIVKRWPFKIFP